MKGVFVTGTDTGIGKTLVSAWLAARWPADYWKPVQSGTDQDSDADFVAALAPGCRIHPSAYRLRAPMSPHEAARRDGIRIEMSALSLPATAGPLVVEGAGGVLVPLNDEALMIDLIARLGLPAVVVTGTRLGTINHTLLTLEALRTRGLPVVGVVIDGDPEPVSRAAITRFGGVPVVADLPRLGVISAAAVAALPAPDFLENLP